MSSSALERVEKERKVGRVIGLLSPRTRLRSQFGMTKAIEETKKAPEKDRNMKIDYYIAFIPGTESSTRSG
jgi:hypothetical protein